MFINEYAVGESRKRGHPLRRNVNAFRETETEREREQERD